MRNQRGSEPYVSASGERASLYGCLNRECCHRFADALREYTVFAQVVIAFIAFVKLVNVRLMWWFQSHLDDAVNAEGKDSTKQEKLHHHRHRWHVLGGLFGIVLCGLGVIVAVQLTIFQLRACGETATVAGNLDVAVAALPEDEDLGAALPFGETQVEGST